MAPHPPTSDSEKDKAIPGFFVKLLNTTAEKNSEYEANVITLESTFHPELKQLYCRLIVDHNTPCRLFNMETFLFSLEEDISVFNCLLFLILLVNEKTKLLLQDKAKLDMSEMQFRNLRLLKL